MQKIQVYFSDFFRVDREVIEAYGAVDISLINDLPLFVDPFLLFNHGRPGDFSPNPVDASRAQAQHHGSLLPHCFRHFRLEGIYSLC